MSATHNVEQMRQHIMSLIKRHDIVVEWCRRPTQASAIHVAEEIRIAPIQSAISYATALHEIGHIVGQHQRSQNSMVREHWAWHWAEANALIWTPVMQRLAQSSLHAHRAVRV